MVQSGQIFNAEKRLEAFVEGRVQPPENRTIPQATGDLFGSRENRRISLGNLLEGKYKKLQCHRPSRDAPYGNQICTQEKRTDD